MIRRMDLGRKLNNQDNRCIKEIHMTDITAIASILGSVKTATEIEKLLENSDLTLEKAEMKLKLADLICALAEDRLE